MTSQNWAKIQEAVSEFAHTVSYDRLGLGWSTPAVSERIPSKVVEELRAMLQTAGVASPFLLVGHSSGGWWFATLPPNIPTRWWA